MEYQTLKFVRKDKERTWNLETGIKELPELASIFMYGPYEVCYSHKYRQLEAETKLLNSVITTLLSEIEDVKDCLS